MPREVKELNERKKRERERERKCVCVREREGLCVKESPYRFGMNGESASLRVPTFVCVCEGE